VALWGALANGIIPADERDAGAGAVQAGSRLAERARGGVNAELYVEGLNSAMELARAKFGRELDQLPATELHELMQALEAAAPGFFRQLRMEVCAFYLSDPEVWKRIGFPGPSTGTGGYPDFDQKQR